MSPWLLTIVVVLVAFTLAAVALVVPVFKDLNRHRKDRLADADEPKNDS